MRQHVRPCLLDRSMSANDPAGFESTGTTTAESPPETITTIDWEGPLSEHDAYGTPTGYTYVQCPDCGVEVLTGRREHVTHRRGCPHR